MPRIFISYRRADSAAVTGRIHDRLIAMFGEKNVFKDVDDILPGEDFREVLEREVSQCDVLLAIIGQQWSAIADEDGHKRLHDPDDFVNIEVEAGLKRDTVLVIPVLVNDASMPNGEDLPDNLKALSYRNAIVIRNDPDFNRDMARLIQRIQVYPQRLNPSPVRRLFFSGIGVVAALLIIAIILFTQSERIFGAQVTPTATTTLSPTDSLTLAPTAATVPIAQSVARALDEARVWSIPNVNQGEIVANLDPDTHVIVVHGPTLGLIREDTDTEGGWYQVRGPDSTDILGWVWGERLMIADDEFVNAELPADAIRMSRNLFETDPWMFGDDVLFVQGRLRMLGYTPGPIDGYFGPRTKLAVSEFQQRNNLTVDGIVGNITWRALFGVEAR